MKLFTGIVLPGVGTNLMTPRMHGSACLECPFVFMRNMMSFVSECRVRRARRAHVEAFP